MPGVDIRIVADRAQARAKEVDAMIVALVAGALLVAGAGRAAARIAGATRSRRRTGSRRRPSASCSRCSATRSLSSALDATLRLARAENATLVPAYLATVPFNLPIAAPLPAQCARAMPLLETIEQRAARLGVPVDSRIETGRSARHALRQLLAARALRPHRGPGATRRRAPASTADDIAWLLENAPGEIVVLRAERNGGGRRRVLAQ